ncbi:Terpene biosynthesis [hydrothermal vent metagenome]|uniref:Terpene biosynthesis n=1 Tax=hydrothermal vent metagenome TaxID=652676 RepID=A0A3B0TTP7_9ZZZZ
MHKKGLQIRFNEIGGQLVSEIGHGGFWHGRLSSSALGVAVAVAALHFDGCGKNSKEIGKGLKWLEGNINDDGSFGDTPESPGNISTSLLVYAAVNLYAGQVEWVKTFQAKIAGYLVNQGIDVHSSQVSEAIIAHYRKDYTFSVPILTMCGLCNVPGKDAFNHIPQLPFELSLLPRRFYSLLNLSVVSYAIPALVAVGIVIFKKKKSGLFWRIIRHFSIRKAIAIIHRMLPESGGFLEAIPLTAFVSLSLINAGYKETTVVRKGIEFLKTTQRKDGSWPIDVDLSTWVTSLSVKAFRSNLSRFLTPRQQDKIASHFKRIQNRGVHPFNGTQPGGWGWTSYAGSVPDGDDTPGVILALLKLQPEEEVKEEVLAGCRWLQQLQNNDGGFPTFSKGWGRLPFDRSCSDLTGHCMLAISSVIEKYKGELAESDVRKFGKSFKKALRYLEEKQSGDGSWLPLWFGNQQTEGHVNPVYGTARILSYLKDSVCQDWHSKQVKQRLDTLIVNAAGFLISVQNGDGSWGGGKSVPGTIEETSLAVSALSSVEYKEVCNSGLTWLDGYTREYGLKAAPIGLYFASLWYDEKMYPATAYLEALARMLEIEE